jgi:hypothetical protein
MDPYSFNYFSIFYLVVVVVVSSLYSIQKRDDERTNGCGDDDPPKLAADKEYPHPSITFVKFTLK